MRIDELTRLEILNKGKKEDPAKYARRLNYVSTIKPMSVAKDLFIKTGTLTVPISVGDYTVTVHVSGIMKLVRGELDHTGQTLPDRPLVYRALRRAVDTCQIQCECTCPDFRYRHAYWATQNNYKYGTPERRPSNITNPDNTGAVCKHTTAALVRPSQWLKYVSGWISTVIRAFLENRLGLDSTDISDLKGKAAEDAKDSINALKDADGKDFENSEVEVKDEDVVEPEAETTEEETEEPEKPEPKVKEEPTAAEAAAEINKEKKGV